MMQINSRWTWRLQHTKEKSLIRKFPMTFRFFRGRETGFRQVSMIQQGCNGVGHLVLIHDRRSSRSKFTMLLFIIIDEVSQLIMQIALRVLLTKLSAMITHVFEAHVWIWYFIGRVGNDQLSTCVSDECSDLNVWLSEIKKYFVIDKNERSEEENKTSNERKNSWERRSARGKGKEKIVQKVNFYFWRCFGWVMCVW